MIGKSVPANTAAVSKALGTHLSLECLRLRREAPLDTGANVVFNVFKLVQEPMFLMYLKHAHSPETKEDARIERRSDQLVVQPIH